MEVGIPYTLERGVDTVDPAKWLDFNVDDALNYLRLEEVRGLGLAPLRTPTEPRPQRDGSIVYDYWRSGRYVTARGRTRFARTAPAADADDSLYQRRLLLNRLARWLDALVRSDGVLRWTPTGAEQRANLIETGTIVTDAMRSSASAPPTGTLIDDAYGTNLGAYGIYQAYTNLVPNGNGSTNVTGWAAISNGDAPVRTTTAGEFLVPPAAVVLENTGAGAAEWSVKDGGSRIAVTANKAYTISAWGKRLVEPYAAQIGIAWYDSGGALISTVYTSDQALPSGVFTRMSLTATAPAAAVTAEIRIKRVNGSSASKLAIAGAQLDQCQYLRPYVHTDGAAVTKTSGDKLEVYTRDPAAPAGRSFSIGNFPSSSFGGGTRAGGMWGVMKFVPRWAYNQRDNIPSDLMWLYGEEPTTGTGVELYYDVEGGADEFKFALSLSRSGSGDPIVKTPAQSFAANSECWVMFYISPEHGEIGIRGPSGGWQTAAFAEGTYSSKQLAMLGFGQFADSQLDGDLHYAAFGRGDVKLTEADATYFIGRPHGPRLRELIARMPQADPQVVIAPEAEDVDGVLQGVSEDTAATSGNRGKIWVPGQRRLVVRTFEGIDPSADLTKEWMFQLVAGDPTVLGDQLEVDQAAASPWRTWAHNRGTSEGWPVVRVHGSATPVTAVDVVNVDTGKKIRLTSISIGAGQYVEIDMQRESVKRSDGTNYLNKLDQAASEFWSIAAEQVDQIELQTITGTPSKIEVRHRDAWASG